MTALYNQGRDYILIKKVVGHKLLIIILQLENSSTMSLHTSRSCIAVAKSSSSESWEITSGNVILFEQTVPEDLHGRRDDIFASSAL